MTKAELEVQLPLLYDLIGASSMITRRTAIAVIQDMFDHLPESYEFHVPSNVISMEDYRNSKWVNASDDDWV